MSKDHNEPATEEVAPKNPELKHDLAQLAKLQTEYNALKKTCETSDQAGEDFRKAKARKLEVVLAMDVIKRKHDLP